MCPLKQSYLGNIVQGLGLGRWDKAIAVPVAHSGSILVLPAPSALLMSLQAYQDGVGHPLTITQSPWYCWLKSLGAPLPPKPTWESSAPPNKEAVSSPAHVVPCCAQGPISFPPRCGLPGPLPALFQGDLSFPGYPCGLEYSLTGGMLLLLLLGLVGGELRPLDPVRSGGSPSALGHQGHFQGSGGSPHGFKDMSVNICHQNPLKLLSG